MDGVQLPQGYSHFEGAVYFFQTLFNLEPAPITQEPIMLSFQCLIFLKV